MTERTPLSVSVVIAAFNARPFISRAIASALAQDEVTLEVVVGDDASTDGTADFVMTAFAGDPRVKVVSLKRNGGPSAARNAAIEAASGEWIAVLDADDAFAPGHLRELVALADASGADIVAGNFWYCDPHREARLGTGLRLADGLAWVDPYSFLQGARPYTDEADFGLLKPLFRLSFLREHGLRYPVDVRHGEDMELVLTALLAGARYGLRRDLCSYLYSSRDSGQSRTRIDYAGQAERTLALRHLPQVRDDHRLKALLVARADALRRLELERHWTHKTAKPAQIVVRALKSGAGRRWLMARAVNKLVG